jgi:fatty-acyl-CoA synthase
VLVGGSTCPESLIRRVEDRLGAQVQTSWGMTELSPMGTIAPPGARGAAHSGRPPLGLDIRLTNSDGVALPEQRGKVGHLRVRGASVIDRYFNAEEDALDADGFFDTGDLAMLDAEGHLVICGRSKDLIKSGGEWINPAEIEAIAGADPSICAAAVIARSDEKWGERPVLVIQPREGHTFEPGSLLETLRGRVADWWIPTEVAQVSEMPLAATGKIDKNRLREQIESGALEARHVAI